MKKADFLSFLYPKRCPRCDGVLPPREGAAAFLCPACMRNLPLATEPLCRRCGRKLSSEEKDLCTRCRTGRQEFVSGRGVFLYDDDIKQMMYRFKYAERREYAAAFAVIAASVRKDWLCHVRPEALIPVPMYRKKQALRGYNQAADFAAALAGVLHIPVKDRLVRRDRDTLPMKGLTEEERRGNLKDAFSVDQDALISLLEERRPLRLLIIDDIYTTGATVNAVAEVLKKEIKDRCNEDAQLYFLSICIGEDATQEGEKPWM